jgi:hypothetical protein
MSTARETLNMQPVWWAIDATTGEILAGPTTRRKASNLGRTADTNRHGVAVTSDKRAAHQRKAKIEASRARSVAFFTTCTPPTNQRTQQ